MEIVFNKLESEKDINYSKRYSYTSFIFSYIHGINQGDKCYARGSQVRLP